jgi:hypothetical protein
VGVKIYTGQHEEYFLYPQLIVESLGEDTNGRSGACMVDNMSLAPLDKLTKPLGRTYVSDRDAWLLYVCVTSGFQLKSNSYRSTSIGMRYTTIFSKGFFFIILVLS